jgi:tetratricopeptide (TPR) repeat protein
LNAPSHLVGKQRLCFMGLVIAMLFAQNALAEAVLVADAASEALINEAFTKGMSLREAGDYEAAIAAFQGVLSSEPTLGRARAELAVTYFRALNFASARAEAEKVLADPKTPDGVKLTVQYFLDEMDKQSKPHVFTPYVTFGVGHDTNINAGPSSSTINLGGGQIGQLASGASPISNNFNMLNVGLAIILALAILIWMY